jgi:hypothetical protein
MGSVPNFISSHAAMNPTGGADTMRRVMEESPLDPVSVYQWYTL